MRVILQFQHTGEIKSGDYLYIQNSNLFINTVFFLTYPPVSFCREMTESISYLCTRKVSHGGLANRESYVLDLDSKLKLINVARYSTDGSTTRDDVVDFFDLLCTEDRINASGNGNVEWEGFDYLIKSNSMYNTRYACARVCNSIFLSTVQSIDRLHF